MSNRNGRQRKGKRVNNHLLIDNDYNENNDSINATSDITAAEEVSLIQQQRLMLAQSAVTIDHIYYSVFLIAVSIGISFAVAIAVVKYTDQIKEVDDRLTPIRVLNLQGIPCWDTNNDAVCNLATEDINEDGECNSLDCKGTDCWDLDANLLCDLDTEDINEDGVCNVTDCQGADGVDGDATVFHCWDLNESGTCNLVSEDINDDGVCNVTDCSAAAACVGVTCTPANACQLRTCINGVCVIT